MSAAKECMVIGSLLVFITTFTEYVLKVTIKIIFHHSKTVFKIDKLSILMSVCGGGGIQNSMFGC